MVMDDFLKRTIRVGLLLCLGLIACSCREEPVEPSLIEDFPRIEISAAEPYGRLTKLDKHCTVTIVDKANVLLQSEGKIQLRGNSTARAPKRPFLLQLDAEASILDMPAANDWLLLANYYDKTMLRNALAFRLAEDSRLNWTPHARFVELWYNNEHKGTYQLCEKIQPHPHRLNIPQDGWLVEIDTRTPENEPQFRTQHIEQPIHVLYPKNADFTGKTDAVAQFFAEAENALFGPSFADSTGGWRDYLDENAFIDWYLINEIAKSVDATFFSSCYMYGGQDGKIVIGPIWDFDLAFGNTTYSETDNPQGWHIRYATWYLRLFEDPNFVQAVKTQFDDFYQHREDYYQFIRSQAEILRPHVQANDNHWHTMSKQIWHEQPLYTYDDNIAYLLSWLSLRLEWMKNNW